MKLKSKTKLPLATAKKRKTAPAKPHTRVPPDAIALLKADHARVDALFSKFEKLDGPAEKQSVVQVLCDELTVHMQVEEEILYPALRTAIGDNDLMDEADVEHGTAKDLIAQLRGAQPGDAQYDAKVTVLAEYIRHHVKEEHTEMFPKAKAAKLDLKALGQRMAERKVELLPPVEGPLSRARESVSRLLPGWL